MAEKEAEMTAKDFLHRFLPTLRKSCPTGWKTAQAGNIAYDRLALAFYHIFQQFSNVL